MALSHAGFCAPIVLLPLNTESKIEFASKAISFAALPTKFATKFAAKRLLRN